MHECANFSEKTPLELIKQSDDTLHGERKWTQPGCCDALMGVKAYALQRVE